MPLASFIARRAGSAVYYARLTVPLDVQAVVGRRELWQSLRTKDPREAKARVLAVLSQWKDEFAALRRRREATEDDLRAATVEHYEEELANHHRARQSLPTVQELEAETAVLAQHIAAGTGPCADDPPTVTWGDDPLSQVSALAQVAVRRDAAAMQAQFRAGRRKALEEHLGRGETVLVQDAADALIAREGFAIERGSRAYRDVCQRLQRAELEALRRAQEHDAGDYTGRPRDPLVKPAAGRRAAPVAAPGESILELFDAYAADNRKRLTADTLDTNRKVVALFVEFVGATLPASAIDKRGHVFKWKEALRRYPVRAAEIGAFRGMGFKQVLAENERLGRPTLSDKTVNRYLSALGGFCSWAQGNGHLDSNPVSGMLIERDRDRNRSAVRPYSTADLTTLFRSPVFTGCLGDGREHKPGDVQPDDHRRWLPLLALFTGARLGELAQLNVADVRQERGRWVLDITAEGEGNKTLKTKGSERVIPLHRELELLGFTAFHARRAAADDPRLFPEIDRDARGQLTGHVSRWWGRYVARVGIKADKALNFHSFRHGFTDALRRAGYRDDEFAFLLGHSRGGTTKRYGVLREGELAQRCALVDAVSFPGLDLSHLHRRGS